MPDEERRVISRMKTSSHSTSPSDPSSATPRGGRCLGMRKEHPRGAVAFYFMTLCIVIFAFIAMTLNFWIVTYTKVSLQCAADTAALAGADVQAHALNQIAESNGKTVKLWNDFRDEYVMEGPMKCTVWPINHFYHFCFLPLHMYPLARVMAILNVQVVVVKYWVEMLMEMIARLESVVTGMMDARDAAFDTADKNLRHFFTAEVADQCEVTVTTGGMSFKQHIFQKQFEAFFEWWSGCTLTIYGIQHGVHMPYDTAQILFSPPMPLWWTKERDVITYTRVAITLPEGALPYLGQAVFGESPAITAVGQARPYGGMCYMKKDESVDDQDKRRAYPYYRAKLFALSRTLPNQGMYPMGTSSSDYKH